MLLASRQVVLEVDDVCGDDSAVDAFYAVNTICCLVLLNCDGVASLASGARQGWVLMVIE